MSDADPGETYSWHHRTSAAQELIRRGWDTNYDKITPKMLQEYWRDQQSTRLSVGQKKHLAGFHTFLDEYDQYDDKDYAAMAREMKEAEDLAEAAAYKSRLRRATGNPSMDRIDINKTPSPSTGEGRDGGEKSLNPSPTKSEQEALTPHSRTVSTWLNQRTRHLANLKKRTPTTTAPTTPTPTWTATTNP